MKKYFLLILAAMLLLLISCNSEGIGIFYKISVEPPLSTSALSEKRIYKIVSDGTDTYVLAGAAIYKENGSEWDKLTAPTDPSDSTKTLQAVSLATVGTAVLSVLASDISSSVYELSGSTWSLATNGLVDSNDLFLLEGGDGINLFICEETTSTDNYDIYSYAPGTNVIANLTGAATISMPIISATYDGVNDFYLVSSDTTNFVSDAVIYTTDASTTVDTTAVPGIAAAIGSIIYYTDTLYAATKDGFIYSSEEAIATAAGLVWSKVNTTALVNSYGGNTAKLGPMEILTIGTDYMLIGSDTGYFEMALPPGMPVSPTAVTVRGDTVYEAIELYQDMVFSILKSSVAGDFYVGTENGLWYSNSAGFDLK